MKLIKLNEQHYIVVDDSEIKENDWYWTPIKRSIEQCVKKLLIIKGGQNDIEQLKITHSTPIGGLSAMLIAGIRELSLSEVEEAINGYSVEKIYPILSFEEYLANPPHKESYASYVAHQKSKREGFNAHREFVKDKFFTTDDMELMFGLGAANHANGKPSFQEAIQSLLPKTEWECSITPEGKIVLL